MSHPLHHPLTPVLMSAVVVTFLFLFFFPPMFVSIDEHQYLKNALLLQNGQLKDADPLSYCGGAQKGDEYLSNYHIGKSFSLIPFTWVDFPFVMISGLVIHLLNTFIFYLILRALKVNTWLVGLFAFYPAFLWESRTLFSETVALSFLLGGVLFYLKRIPRAMAVAGILFGLAAFVRHEMILISAGFGLALFWNTRKELFHRSNLFWYFALGGVLAAILLLGWNAWYNGNPFSTQLGSPAQLFTTFPQPLFWANLAGFIGILLVAYPLLLLAPLRTHALKLELILASILTIFLFAQTTNISVYPFLSPLTITARMRYLIPLAGLLLIAYATVLSSFIPHLTRVLGKTNLSRIGIAIALIFMVGATGLHFMHQELVENRATVGAQIKTITPNSALIIGSSDDCIYILPILSGDRKYVKVNDPNQDVFAIISAAETPVYVLQLTYSNQSDSDVRQGVIDAERRAINDFILAHAENLIPIYSTKMPHSLTIYQWNEN